MYPASKFLSRSRYKNGNWPQSGQGYRGTEGIRRQGVGNRRYLFMSTFVLVFEHSCNYLVCSHRAVQVFTGVPLSLNCCAKLVARGKNARLLDRREAGGIRLGPSSRYLSGRETTSVMHVLHYTARVRYQCMCCKLTCLLFK